MSSDRIARMYPTLGYMPENVPSARTALLIAGLVAISAVGGALVSQHLFDMAPCAWCVLQRIILLSVGVVCLAGASMPRIARPLAGIGALLGLTGAGAAWFQVTVASNLESCDRTLADRLVTGSGLDDLVPAVFGVYANCADAKVYLLGVEYASWGLILFIGLCTGLAGSAILGPRRA